MSIGCPHCGATTDLYAAPPMPSTPVAPPPPPPPPLPLQAPRLQVAGVSSLQSAVNSPPRLQVAAPPPPPPVETVYEPEYAEGASAVRGPVNWIGWSLAAISILLFLIGGGMYLSNARQGKSAFGDSRSGRGGGLKSTVAKPAAADDEDEDDEAVAAASKNAARPKSIEDLKPSPIALQKGQGSLVYAVGTLRNESDHQRLGVRIELDLLDASGKRLGQAKDYVQAIEPHRDWRFRALVMAPRTASVRVAKITEEE
jgi:hypothetical protein